MGIRIILADDHTLVRDGLKAILEKIPGITVVAEAGNGRQAVRLSRELLPEVVIMDLEMPEMDGIDATRSIVSEMPGVKVLILSMHTSRHYIVKAFNAGAMGYLLKNHCSSMELAAAIHCVSHAGLYLSPRVEGDNITEHARRAGEQDPAMRLTLREREVLQLVAEGKNTKEVAYMLHVSGKTVESHRTNIMKKLSINNVAGLTKYAISQGLTTLDR